MHDLRTIQELNAKATAPKPVWNTTGFDDNFVIGVFTLLGIYDEAAPLLGVKNRLRKIYEEQFRDALQYNVAQVCEAYARDLLAEMSLLVRSTTEQAREEDNA